MLKIGVTGVGKFGENHTRILSNLDNCKLIGVYDKDKKRAKSIAKKYNCNYFPKYENLLDKIDALLIVVTTSAHFALAKTALEKSVHLFIEKPITSEYEQAQKLVELADRKNLKIQVGHIERFNPVIRAIESEIDNPKFIECHRIAPFTPRVKDVPVVLDLMIHDIDLILSFVPSKVKAIHASGSKVLTNRIDIANARIEFENDAVANVTASRISLKQSRKIRFFQENSYLSLDFQNQTAQIVKKSKNIKKILPLIMMGKKDFKKEDLVDIKDIKVSNQQKDALTCELESFIKTVNDGIKPVVDGKEGTRALKIAFDIIKTIN